MVIMVAVGNICVGLEVKGEDPGIGRAATNCRIIVGSSVNVMLVIIYRYLALQGQGSGLSGYKGVCVFSDFWLVRE